MKTKYEKPEIKTLSSNQVIEALGSASAGVYGGLGGPGGNE